MSEIFLDTETTGLSFRDGHKLVEIACIETEDFVPTKKIFHKFINPKRNVPDEAFKIHGFTTDFLNNKETFDKVADQLLDFIKDKKIIIHNASFDLGFLNHELRLLKKNEIDKKNVVDSLELARSKFPSGSNSLDALCKKFNIDLSQRVKHNALLDCELLREVYINLIDVKEPKLIFSDTEEFVESKIESTSKNYCKKIIEISAEETTRHKIFLKQDLKKNNY
ncbi:DNA polymerase III subunit epsilon [Pelagibacteraceae bacterium]|jgi:DNA polymerase-3 subunit epsilon|nr:DNA polymerase III subunit epsilon [Pelagibacteraceae bacterium]|tara:strand:+ start:9799 stop:10467 length:669 start_codon:yes stop_codon:yes gene_type:complete